MDFLKLIARGVKSVVNLPFLAARWIFKVKRYKSVTDYAVTEAGGELKEVSGVKRFFRGLGLILLFLLIVAAFVGAIYGLWLLNRRLDLERQLGGPVPLLRTAWLPLLFLLFCGACLAGLWLWRLLSPLGEPTDIPDIYEAWVEARAAIEEAGIPLTDVPVFLVVGRPAGGVGALFTASRLTFPVRGVPGRGDAPIQVYASAQGIFVACPGASLLGRLATLLAEGGGAAAAPMTAARTVFDDAAEPDAGSPVKLVPAPPGEALLLADEPVAAGPVATERAPRRVPQLLTNTDEVEKARSRLRYLGRLIAHNRAPYCGANGILLLVPFAAADGDGEAHQAAGVCRLDVAAARDGLRTDCPVVALVCDAETAPGAAAFLRLMPEDRKDRLLGQTFPLAPDLPGEKVGGSIGDGLRWAGTVLERVVVRNLRAGDGGSGSDDEAVRTNADLYRFLAAVRTREPRLAHVFGRAAVAEDGRPARFGGGFLAATGPDPSRDQAFVAGVFRLLVDHQNHVTWTPAAKAEDAAFHRWAIIGYLMIGAFLLGIGYMCFRELWN